jgi:N-acetylglucosaminylphosphatidylinositol deacetylase
VFVQVLTFDERGVSNHPNHIATYHGVRLALSELAKQSPNSPLGLKLKSLSILRKFCGVLELFLAWLFADYVVASFGLLTALRGMYVHRSQNLLYRQVFVVISAFTYVNSFAPIS